MNGVLTTLIMPTKQTKSDSYLKFLTFNLSYDDYGRLETKTYPNNFEVDYAYNQYGYLNTIKNGSTVLWDCEAINSMGQVTNYKMGTRTSTVTYDSYGELQTMSLSAYKTLNYDFDDLGNLASREDGTRDLKEEFSYDAMNRLTHINYYENDIHQYDAKKIMEYDDDGYGNVKAQTGVGVYEYNGPTPHAVSKISFGDVHPDRQVIEYTTFNKVKSITDTDENEEDISLTIEYGVDNQRRKATFESTETPSLNYKKYFLGEYEEKVQGAVTTKYYYVSAPTGLCAIKTVTGSTPKLWHVNTDHLGSPTLLIDAANYANRKEYSFSAWGLRRNPADWSLPDNSELVADRGFTGHEHLGPFSLINMNGRVYDPVVAGFLSPDPYVQMPLQEVGLTGIRIV